MIILSLSSFLVTSSNSTICPELNELGKDNECSLDLRTFSLIMEGDYSPLML